ncbi:unnamed protein product [Phytomonas sp. Hart1]|nr:unnamed protein product [Phytomonas sp. Hart1]|eukprot:CCW70837.1 unnamed protein product [Phytomonas sp. isolate Hart1]
MRRLQLPVAKQLLNWALPTASSRMFSPSTGDSSGPETGIDEKFEFFDDDLSFLDEFCSEETGDLKSFIPDEDAKFLDQEGK